MMIWINNDTKGDEIQDITLHDLWKALPEALGVGVIATLLLIAGLAF